MRRGGYEYFEAMTDLMKKDAEEGGCRIESDLKYDDGFNTSSNSPSESVELVDCILSEKESRRAEKQSIGEEYDERKTEKGKVEGDMSDSWDNSGIYDYSDVEGNAFYQAECIAIPKDCWESRNGEEETPGELQTSP